MLCEKNESPKYKAPLHRKLAHSIKQEGNLSEIIDDGISKWECLEPKFGNGYNFNRNLMCDYVLSARSVEENLNMFIFVKKIMNFPPNIKPPNIWPPEVLEIPTRI